MDRNVIREYAKNLAAVEARSPGGEQLKVSKISKNRWRVGTKGTDVAIVSYRV